MSMFIEKITKREKQILNLIAKEFTAKEIALELYISQETVNSHRSNLLAKLNARNTAGMIIKSLRYNILELKAIS